MARLHAQMRVCRVLSFWIPGRDDAALTVSLGSAPGMLVFSVWLIALSGQDDAGLTVPLGSAPEGPACSRVRYPLAKGNAQCA